MQDPDNCHLKGDKPGITKLIESERVRVQVAIEVLGILSHLHPDIHSDATRSLKDTAANTVQEYFDKK